MQLQDALRLGPTEVVSIVGGGGKTTLMFRIADEIVAAGGQVVTTTTTRIFAAQTSIAPYHLALDDPSRLSSELPTLLETYPHVLITGNIHRGAGKAFGVATRLVGEIQGLIGNKETAIIVEADGSRMRSLKAPAVHEPVIPKCTTIVVAVAGADIFGQPLSDKYVHRASLVAELVAAPPATPVTPDMVAELLLHPQGGMKDLPAAARWISLLNKTESEAHLAPARKTARLLLEGGADEVLLSAVSTDDPVRERWGRVAAIVLAAGGSTRMALAGEVKQLLPWGEGTLLSHATDVALASEASSVVAVVGCQARRAEEALGGRCVNVVENRDWLAGQSTSLHAGLCAVDLGTTAAVFLLVDQPGVGPAVIDALIHKYRITGAPVVAPRVGGQRANPVLFDCTTWDELRKIRGDTGGRVLFEMYADRIAWVDWSEEIMAEVNTPQDYSALQMDREGSA